MTAPISSDTSLPNHTIDPVEQMAEELQVARDVEAGYSTIKKHTTKYLPRHPKEEWDNYQIRLDRPAFFNAYARTTGGLTGMVFRRDPVLGTDVPDTIKDHWENIDNAGTHGDVFLKEVFHDALIAGHAGILVDLPPIPEGLTKAEEQDLGARPFWLHVKKDDILSWRLEVIRGVLVLTQIVIREHLTESSGAFGETPLTRYRVLRLVDSVVTFELWEARGDGTPEKGDTGIITGVSTIPFVPVYAHRTGVLQSKPPLIDLAWLVIRHYQTNSDMLHAAHIANVPIPVITGADSEKVVLGPNTAMFLEQGGTFTWAETSGTAIGLTSKLLEDMRTEMSVLGLGILERRPMTAETATAKRIDRSEKDSQLSAAARSMKDAVEMAFMHHASFLGQPSEVGAGTLTLNRDFMELTLTPDQIRVYVDAVKEGQFSLETLWAILQEGNALPAQFDADEELKRLRATTVVEPTPTDGDE